jgi:hypothetical protein
MKTYRIEFAEGYFSTSVMLILITIACLSIILLPIGIAQFPVLYKIVVEE